MNLTISLVTYHSNLEYLAQTLKSLEQALLHPQLNLQSCHLFLIDNSDDYFYHQKLKKFTLNKITLTLIESKKNLGYGKGNNLVLDYLKKEKSSFHLVINPDVEVKSESLFHAINYLEKNTSVGMITPAVFSTNGERQLLCKQHPTFLIMFLRALRKNFLDSIFSQQLKAFENREKNYQEKMEKIEYPTGCFMFFRTQLFLDLKGFDPRYFLHYEDADLGRRIAELYPQTRIDYLPQVEIVHHWNRETHKKFISKMITIFSGIQYLIKWNYHL